MDSAEALIGPISGKPDPRVQRLMGLRKTVSEAGFSIRCSRRVPAASPGRRRAGWNAAGRGGVALLLLCLMGQAAWAEDAEEPGWIPSISLAFDTFAYNTDASAENHLNPPAQEGVQDNASNQLRYQLGAELMSPRLALPGRPRLFVQGGAELGAPSSDQIFEVGNLSGDPEEDIRSFRAAQGADRRLGCEDPPPTCLTAVEGEFEGQGSTIEATITDPSWYAALGVAFEFPVASSLLLQLKPSAVYNVEKVDLSGQMTTVIETGPPTRPYRQTFDVHRGAASDSTTDHSVGCGLELGLVIFRSVRPVTTSLYVNARFLWLLGDTTTTFSDPGGLATFSVDREPFTIRGGAGLRFSWLGFGGR